LMMCVPHRQVLDRPCWACSLLLHGQVKKAYGHLHRSGLGTIVNAGPP
jgi:hypothetical protein